MSIEIDRNAYNLPTGFWIMKAYGNKGEIVVVEIKKAVKNGKILKWKSPSSKKMSLYLKVEIAKKYVKWVCDVHPDVATNCDINGCQPDLSKLTTEEVTTLNGIQFTSDYDPYVDTDQKNDKKKPPVQNIAAITSAMSQNENTTIPSILPKHCYYRPASDKRGDKFVIDKHPALVASGKRQWCTSESKKISTENKYKALLAKLEELST